MMVGVGVGVGVGVFFPGTMSITSSSICAGVRVGRREQRQTEVQTNLCVWRERESAKIWAGENDSEPGRNEPIIL
jgi:hypothetical protein